MLRQGSRIAGKYELERRIGKGGMGEVWLARHVALGERRVAIKFLVNALSPELLERFHREARIASQIRSRHVVEVLDFGEHENTPFLVMEYLEGRELRELLDERTRLDPISALEILVQAAKGLQKAHDAGLIHRDVKPENLYLTTNEDGNLLLKILDFGIAKSVATEPQTATGAMIGTVYYMSPEQFQGKKGLDHRTDLWSLACVAYEMLVGERVYTGDSVLMIGMQLLGGERPVPSRKVPGLPRAFDAWFAKATHPDITKRFATAQELVAALASALGVQEAHASLTSYSGPLSVPGDTHEPVSAIARLSAPARLQQRLPPRVWLPLLGAVVVVSAAVSFLLRPSEAQPPPAAALPPVSIASSSVSATPPSASPTADLDPASPLLTAVALLEKGRIVEAHQALRDVPPGDLARSDPRFERVENAWADHQLAQAQVDKDREHRAILLTEVVSSGAGEDRRARARDLLASMDRKPAVAPKTARGTPPGSKTGPSPASASPPTPPSTNGTLPPRF